MTNSGTDRFWYDVYREGVRNGVISEDDNIESTNISTTLPDNESENIDSIYAAIKEQMEEPEFDLQEATWFFDLAKTELKQRLD